MPKLKQYLIETKEVMLDALSTMLRGGARQGEPDYYVQGLSCLVALPCILVGATAFLTSSDQNSTEFAKRVLEIGSLGAITYVASSAIDAFKNVRRRLSSV